ncbi:hypothetical protein LSH36_28g02064 [Paralvinella palmiformis]|uniref:Uncharacterized protein n=1 Tax=Paralvinella palmiformis TaxID=53620 RepID=A0AAD9K973_9ANNE|nr:hypothetical protein LSH36_28g02064 [Paralvinella palmiformis]
MICERFQWEEDEGCTRRWVPLVAGVAAGIYDSVCGASALPSDTGTANVDRQIQNNMCDACVAVISILRYCNWTVIMRDNAASQ